MTNHNCIGFLITLSTSGEAESVHIRRGQGVCFYKGGCKSSFPMKETQHAPVASATEIALFLLCRSQELSSGNIEGTQKQDQPPNGGSH